MPKRNSNRGVHFDDIKLTQNQQYLLISLQYRLQDPPPYLGLSPKIYQFFSASLSSTFVCAKY